MAGLSAEVVEANQGNTFACKDATQGSARGRNEPYAPLCVAAEPEAGEAWHLWIRVRNGMVLVTGPDEQNPLIASTVHSKAWSWVHLGRWTRQELGRQVKVKTTPKDGARAELDCLAFTVTDQPPDLPGLTTPVLRGDAARYNTPAGDVRIAQIEAEDCGVGRVVKDPQASGGHAIEPDGPWNPGLRCVLPTGWDGPYTVWIRHAGGRIALKAARGDEPQRELVWVETDRPDYRWSKVGTWPRAALADHTLVIRGDGDAPVRIDALIFSRTEAIPRQARGAIDQRPPLTIIDQRGFSGVH